MKTSPKYRFIFSTIFFLFVWVASTFAQVQFIENKGQWDSRVKFMSLAGDGAFFLEQNGYTVDQYSGNDVQSMQAHNRLSIGGENRAMEGKIRKHAYSVEFLNSQKPEIIADKVIPTVNNYFIGNDPTKWASNCRIFQAVLYKNIYPGIDIRYYVDENERMKYDIIVNPGADVSKFAMKYKGAGKLEVRNKELLISTTIGTNKELKPYTYQIINNLKKEVECNYEVTDNIVRFKLKNFDSKVPLIIDPQVVFFTYSGSSVDNWGFTATYGADGSIYGGGIVFGQGFPVSPGSYDQTFAGAEDIGIIKISSDGSTRLYATYIGGSGQEQPHSLIEDSQGNLIVAGRTNSPDYPVVGNGRFGSNGGYDIVVTKINRNGTALIGSMKIGGTGADGVNIADRNRNSLNSLKRNYGDDARSEVIVDDNDNIYLASCTQSVDFPTTSGAFQTSKRGAQDAVVLKINKDCNTVLFSTMLGGAENDAAYVLRISNNNSIYVAGGTASPDLNGISSSGVFKSNFSTPSSQASDPADGFIIELSDDGSRVIRGTYLGTEKADQIYGMDTDESGNIYAMGLSEGNMQVINANYSNQGSKQFITKFKPDLSAIEFQTVFGSVNSGVPNISPTAFMVDRCENMYVSGWGGYSNTNYLKGNVRGMPLAGEPQIQRTTSGTNFYFLVLERNANNILYGTYFGQGQKDVNGQHVDRYGDHVDGGTSRFDKRGIIYQAVCADCGGRSGVSIRGTPGSWSPYNMAKTQSECNLGLMKIEMDFTGVHAALRSTMYGQKGRLNGCVPVDVLFEDTLRMGTSYKWLFGDGTPEVTTTEPRVEHQYTKVGEFQVRLITINATFSCHPQDTAYVKLKIGDNRADPSFDYSRLLPCENLDYRFVNTSTNFHNVPFKPNIFTWNFDDGTVITVPDKSPINHSFAGEGIYNVSLTIDDDDFCNSPITYTQALHVAYTLKANFTTPQLGCAPYTAVVENTSKGGSKFVWDFGDGSAPVEGESPTHLYQNPGTYTIKLKVSDENSCNQQDETQFTIQVQPKPTAAYTFTPLTPEENVFTLFANQSLNATKFKWDFGDGESSTEAAPRHIFPATGTYNVCLIAYNDFGCTDTICGPVSALIKPAMDVPSAFTPTQPGNNQIIKVFGFGIVKMEWNIYNRWGQKVFTSNSVSNGWDGTFKGKVQPMDVYAYTLEVEFSDGKKVRKTGDITLVR